MSNNLEHFHQSSNLPGLPECLRFDRCLRLKAKLVVTTALILTFSPKEKGQRLYASLLRSCVVRIQSRVFFWFSSMRELVGGNLTPALSPFCYRETRGVRHARFPESRHLPLVAADQHSVKRRPLPGYLLFKTVSFANQSTNLT
jgi:hypothetical protein